MPADWSGNRAEDPLTGTRKRADYSAAERAFSILLQRRLDDLLRGRRNYLPLMRKYPKQPDRLGIIRMPRDVPPEQLRIAVVEKLTWEALEFVRSESEGGPVSQALDRQGRVIECQAFPTKYPHVVIERTDRYDAADDEPVDITWCLKRVQNQREAVQINRVLDAVNLGIELVRMVG